MLTKPLVYEKEYEVLRPSVRERAFQNLLELAGPIGGVCQLSKVQLGERGIEPDSDVPLAVRPIFAC